MTDPDSTLMLRFQAGDESAFDCLVERQKQRVLNLVSRFLGRGSSDAEDVAQEVFVRIYQAKSRYRPTARFTTWLYVICRNLCYRELRDEQRKGLPRIRLGHAATDGRVPDVEDRDGPAADDATLREERTRAVRAAIASLPENQRMAVLLHRYENLSYRELSEVLGIGPTAVKSLLHRARMSLKSRLANFVESGEFPRNPPGDSGINSVKRHS